MKKSIKEILDKYVPKKPNKFLAKFFRLLLFFTTLKHQVEYVYEFDKKEYKNKPVILLADHSSRDNFYFVLKGYKLSNPNVVVGYQNVVDKKFFKLFLKLGVIPKYLYAPDFKATKSILRLIHDGASICFFPEGIQSSIGSTHPMNPATLKLVKKAGIDVILCKSYGAYLSRPRFAFKYRYGKIKFEYKVLFTKEELTTMSIDEMYERYLKEFAYNDFKYNQIARNVYKGKEANAIGFEKILYYCPKCHSEFNLYTEGSFIKCRCCNNMVEVNKYYDIQAINDSYLPFERLDDWYNYQRKLVREEIQNPDFEISYDAFLYELNQEKLMKDKYYYSGEGTITINHQGIFYRGTRNNKEWNKDFDIRALPSAPLFIDRGNQFFYETEFFNIFPKKDINKSVKYMLIIEELHNLQDPIWAKCSKDVYDIE